MKYGLIGEKLGYSYSGFIHGLLGNDEYELREILPEEIDEFLTKADFRGINVTIPYKEKVMPYCVIDAAAKRIGSVNTIINRNGKMYGYNTDYTGFSYTAKRSGIFFKGRKVVILGNGGTSKTVATVAGDSGAAEIVVISRNGENNYGNISFHADARILVNATPVGMYPDNAGLPVELDVFARLEAVIDVVYNPLRSKLILKAKEMGFNTATGLPMLVAQAVRANELFLGVDAVSDADDESIEKILARTERRFSNLVLIGMPGCGKTTIGRELAFLEDRDFIDTDSEIEKLTGSKPSDIINCKGEAEFRDIEKDVVADAAAKSGIVIATGGGAVLAKVNRDALRQNGTIIFLDRTLESLTTIDRPLSVDLPNLYKQRLPIYEDMCQYRIKVTENPCDVAQKIQGIL